MSLACGVFRVAPYGKLEGLGKSTSRVVVSFMFISLFSLLLAAALVCVARGLSVVPPKAPPRVHACSCGEVVLHVNSPILGVCHCHCAGCRAATGAKPIAVRLRSPTPIPNPNPITLSRRRVQLVGLRAASSDALQRLVDAQAIPAGAQRRWPTRQPLLLRQLRLLGGDELPSDGRVGRAEHTVALGRVLP